MPGRSGGVGKLVFLLERVNWVGSLRTVLGPRIRLRTTCARTPSGAILASMKFLIVDDHAVLRTGLTALLRQARPLDVVLEACDGREGLETARLHPDIDAIFLDLEMPGMHGMPAIEEFGRHHPNLPVIVLSSSENPSDVRRALAAGALGYIPKSTSSKNLLSALQLVLQGAVYVPPLVLNQPPAPPEPVAPVRASAGDRQLTDRQIEVLRLIERGLSNKEIGLALNLSEKTVKVHVTGIFRALNVVTRTQAASEARIAGLV
jgi:two-component system, NarL family, nitrate/nitrite response regulator NarL